MSLSCPSQLRGGISAVITPTLLYGVYAVHVVWLLVICIETDVTNLIYINPCFLDFNSHQGEW